MGKDLAVLREVAESDIPIFFEHQLDNESNWQVAFTHEDPTDRTAFDIHFEKVMKDDTVFMQTIDIDGHVAGYLTKYELENEPQIGFVLGRNFWGKGIATEALRAFLALIPERPVHARTAFDNHSSMRVLEKLEFRRTSEGSYFSNARGIEIVEVLWTLT